MSKLLVLLLILGVGGLGGIWLNRTDNRFKPPVPGSCVCNPGKGRTISPECSVGFRMDEREDKMVVVDMNVVCVNE